MRISGIESYLGGADNVKAFSMIQGEQRKFTGQVVESDGTTPIDITDYTITAQTEFFLADATVTSRAVSINNLVEAGIDHVDLTVDTSSDPTNGYFEMTFPSDLYTAEIDADITAMVPLAVTYVSYDDGDGEIRVNRFVTIIRRGATSIMDP